MARSILAAIAGFIAWLLAWVGIEKLFSAVWPEWYGAPQRAFEEAIANGGQFTADSMLLLMQIAIGSIVSLLSGYLAAVIAGENRRAPLVLGVLLLALGVMKAVLSWPYVPLWYHIIFTALLVPMTLAGGRLKRAASARRGA